MRKARKFHSESGDSFPVLLEGMGGGRYTHTGRVKTNIFKELQIFIRATQSQLY